MAKHDFPMKYFFNVENVFDTKTLYLRILVICLFLYTFIALKLATTQAIIVKCQFKSPKFIHPIILKGIFKYHPFNANISGIVNEDGT